MIENKYIELIYKKIDNEITIDEERELLLYFDSNPDALEEYEKLKILTNYFHDNEVIPPSELKIQVMSDIQQINTKEKNSFSILNSIKETFKRRIQPSLAYSFAAGAVAALLLMTFIFNLDSLTNTLDSNDLSGSFVFDSSMPTDEEAIGKPLRLSDGEGSLIVSYSTDITAIKVKLNTKRIVKIELLIESRAALFIAFERSPNSNGIINTENDVIIIKQSGVGIYTFFFKNRQITNYKLIYRIESEDTKITDSLLIERN